MNPVAFMRWAGNEIKRLWQRIEKIDVQQRLPAPLPALRVIVKGGNTLPNGQTGIKFVEEITSVPSAYDPNVTTSFIDGIGRGPLVVNGVVQDDYVLIVNTNAGSWRNALLGESGLEDTVAVGEAISIPVDGGGSVRAYPPG